MPDVRLIDANALMKNIGKIPQLRGITYGRMKKAVEETPTIDAVEVVRCRDCKHAIVNENHIDKPLICCFTKMVGTTDPDWFCADGKRRMDGGADK